MTTLTKTQKQALLIKAATHAIKQAGAMPVEQNAKLNFKQYGLLTLAGAFTIMIHADCLVTKHPPSITLFCRFQDAKAAKSLGFAVSFYTGEWNHHGLTTLAEVEMILAQITKIRALTV